MEIKTIYRILIYESPTEDKYEGTISPIFNENGKKIKNEFETIEAALRKAEECIDESQSGFYYCVIPTYKIDWEKIRQKNNGKAHDDNGNIL